MFEIFIKKHLIQFGVRFKIGPFGCPSMKQDVKGSFIGNVIIGKSCDEPTNPILLNYKKLEKPNHTHYQNCLMTH